MNHKIASVLKLLFLSVLAPVVLLANIQPEQESSKTEKYLYDTNHVRYELYQTNEGQIYNWLFIPGGPGADSSYLYSLIDELDLPGNVWLIDLPGNGSNISHENSGDYDQWIKLFPEIIQKFDNPILVGHSFGGMFPLLFPELENSLIGFVILNSAPTLWHEESVAYSKQFDLPDLSKEMHEFTLNPSPETFKAALDACMPYYFPKHTIEKGKELFSQVCFQYQPAVWWQRKAMQLNFSAKWVPQKVPTLIIGAKYDCICPFSLFQNDQRFQRQNVELLFIEDAGHMFWIENPKAAKKAFNKFISRLEVN